MTPNESEKKILTGVKEFVKDHKAQYFTLKEIYNDSRFNNIPADSIDKISIIRESLENYESIGVIDRIGCDFHSNG